VSLEKPTKIHVYAVYQYGGEPPEAYNEIISYVPTENAAEFSVEKLKELHARHVEAHNKLRDFIDQIDDGSWQWDDDDPQLLAFLENIGMKDLAWDEIDEEWNVYYVYAYDCDKQYNWGKTTLEIDAVMAEKNRLLMEIHAETAQNGASKDVREKAKLVAQLELLIAYNYIANDDPENAQINIESARSCLVNWG
jgi:hypothetical protein